MSGSKHFAKMARQLIDQSDKGGKERQQQRWLAKQKMQEAMAAAGGADKSGDAAANSQRAVASSRSTGKLGSTEMACACGSSCYYAVVLASLSRVLWMAYEEYELLHACYAEIFVENQRSSLTKRVATYWSTFIFSSKPTKPHRHPQLLLTQCQQDRDAHLAQQAELPLDPVAPIRRSLMAQLLDPFGYLTCRCLRCSNLDAVIDYRVALFSLLTEYCSLFEDYATLFWSSKAKLRRSGHKVKLVQTKLDTQMLKQMMSELYSVMSFKGETENIMTNIAFLQNLIYR